LGANHYICKIYNFESILNSKHSKLKNSNIENYLQILKENDIKTKGFNDLISILKEKKDDFAFVLKDGHVSFFDLDIDNLEGVFKKFQYIRNTAVHLGANISDRDKEWLRSDFVIVIVFFIYTLLKAIDDFERVRKYWKGDYKPDIYEQNLDETPIEIFKRHISYDTLDLLVNNTNYIGEIEELASDLGLCYTCNDCKKEAFVLNVNDSEWNKCFYCGTLFHSGFADCPLCEGDDCVVYDISNIGSNKNVMPAYCYGCNENLKVYGCPVCGCAYSYDADSPIKEFFGDCCSKNFIERSW
jgi:hypothetical protein